MYEEKRAEQAEQCEKLREMNRSGLAGQIPKSAIEREKHIPRQSELLERQITELEECFGNLQGRLQSVRSDESAPTGRVEQAKEQSLFCPLAEHLRQQNARIRNLCERINYQLSVLEI